MLQWLTEKLIEKNIFIDFSGLQEQEEARNYKNNYTTVLCLKLNELGSANCYGWYRKVTLILADILSGRIKRQYRLKRFRKCSSSQNPAKQ